MTKRILTNLGLLLVLVLPVWFGLMWVLTRGVDGPAANDAWPEATLFYFAVLAPQLLAGGVVQQVALLGVPREWSSGRTRLIAVLSTLLIPLALVLFGGEPALLLAPISAVPLALGLLLYGVTQRLPRSAEP